MNINYKAENKENKQLNLEKRNKQNSGIPKPVLYTGLSIAGLGSFALIGKIIYDRSKKNNDKLNERQNTQVKSNEASLTVDNQQIYDNVNEIQNEQQNTQLSADQQIMYKSNVNVNEIQNKPQNQPLINEWEDLVYDHDIQINNKVLSPAFQKWFRQNMILLQQDYPLCWHNTSMQFLACPEIISGEEEYKKEFGEEYPQKIKIMINWMKQAIDQQKKDKNLKIEDYFTEKIRIKKVPEGIRQNADGKENKILEGGKKAGGFIFFKDGRLDGNNKEYMLALPECNYGLFNKRNFIDNIVNLDEYDLGCQVSGTLETGVGVNVYRITQQNIDDKLKFIKNKSKGFTLAYEISKMDEYINNFGLHCNNILTQSLKSVLCYPSNYGYYPTFIAFKATYPTDHWLGFYITYDTNNQVKYAIRADGCHNGFELLNYNELIDTISKECRYGGKPIGTLCIRYSPLNVVKQYYTPELMFNN